MGDMADAIINGDFDEGTGEYIGEGMGFPRSPARDQREKRGELPPFFGSIQQKIIKHGYTITVIRPIDYGMQMKTASGAIINVYQSGKINVQGKPDEVLKSLFK